MVLVAKSGRCACELDRQFTQFRRYGASSTAANEKSANCVFLQDLRVRRHTGKIQNHNKTFTLPAVYGSI